MSQALIQYYKYFLVLFLYIHIQLTEMKKRKTKSRFFQYPAVRFMENMMDDGA